MSTEPTAPEEPVADPSAESGVTVEAPAEASPQPSEPAAEAQPDPKAEEAAVAASAEADLAARLDALFGEDKEAGREPISGAILSDDVLKKLPASVRAVVRHVAAERAKSDEANKAAKAEIEAERAKFAEEMAAARRELQRRQTYLSTLANTKEIREAATRAPPTVDPTTPDGIRALAAYEAQKGLAEALAPIIKSDDDARRAAAYDTLKETYTELRDPKIEEQFVAFLRKENEGIDPTKQAPRLRTPEAARLFVAELRASKAAEDVKRARDAAAADRAPAAAGINRVTTAGTGRTATDIPKDVWNAGGADLMNHMASMSKEQLLAQRAELRRRAAS